MNAKAKNEIIDYKICEETALLIIAMLKKPTNIFPPIGDYSDRMFRELHDLHERGFFKMPGRLGYQISPEILSKKSSILFDEAALRQGANVSVSVNVGNWSFSIEQLPRV